MVSETSVLMIEIEQSIKIQHNKVHAEERILKTLEESKRLLNQKEEKIKKLTNHLKTICNAAESGGLISNQTIESIKILIK